MPRVSVLLPTHNRRDTLALALASLCRQRFTDFEALVVGDGCTDDTAAYMGGICREDPRIRWLDFPKAPRFGYANRNRGLAEATGELVTYLAHDDLFAPDHLTRMVAAWDRGGAGLVMARTLWVAEDGWMVPSIPTARHCASTPEDWSPEFCRMPSVCFLHARADLDTDTVGGWSETIEDGGDRDLWGRILLHHGREALRHVSVPTSLHFRAVWKPQDHISADIEPRWRALREEGHLDRRLRLAPPETGTQQAQFAAALADGRLDWEGLREAAALAVEAYARDLELITIEEPLRVPRLQREVERLQAVARGHRKRAEATEARLDRVAPWHRWFRGGAD